MLTLALLSLAMAADPPGEDAAHRADRRRTQALNRDAGAVTDRRLSENARRQAAYRDAREAWARDMARWRERTARCRAGAEDACRP